MLQPCNLATLFLLMSCGCLFLLFACKSVAGFEVVDRADLLLDVDGIADGGDDRLWVFVSHGAFIKGVLVDRGSVDALQICVDVPSAG